MKSVHVYPSSFEYETRILKITGALIAATSIDEVIIVALAAEHLPDRQKIDDHRWVVRVGTKLRGMRFWTKAARFVEWSARVFFELRNQHVDVVNCHSLSSLPVCVLIAKFHRALLVYEPHELETRTVTFNGIKQRLAALLERALIGSAAEVFTVSDSIADHYQADYRLKRRPDVILNVPPLEDQPPEPNTHLRAQFGIAPSDLIFMYQGVLDEARGCRLLLEAFQHMPKDRHLLFLGFGPMQDEIATAAVRHDNIHFHPAVPPEQVLEYTAGADIGIALLDDTCENHRCALPNKLFHYLHAGLPVVVSDLPEMGSLVDQWQCGWRSANTAEALQECISAITREERDKASAGALASRQELNWNREENKLIAIYARLLPVNTQRSKKEARV